MGIEADLYGNDVSLEISTKTEYLELFFAQVATSSTTTYWKNR